VEFPVNIKTPPAGEPVTVSETKEFLREDRDVEDTLISAQIKAARIALERHTGWHLLPTVFEMSMKAFETVFIPKKPLKSGTVSISYLDENGDSQTLDSSKFIVHEEESPAEIEFLNDLPDLYDTKFPITVTFTAGFESAPEDWKNLVKIITMFYWKRDITAGVNPLQLPMVRSLIQNNMVGRFK
jgi:uncharacterized phiE125 gp8 family phage protein